MAVRDKPDERFEPGAPRQSGVSAEREVEVSRAFEGPVTEGPPSLHPSWQQFEMRHAIAEPHSRATPRMSRMLLAASTLLMMVAPFALTHPAVPQVEDAGFLGLIVGLAALKASAVFVATGALVWRFRRAISLPRRIGYMAGVWSMAIGAGLVASRALPFGGMLVFDAGVLLLLVLAVSDDRLRHGRTRRTA